MDSWRKTDDLTDVILARVGPGTEGDRERRPDGKGGLQKPSGLKCPQGVTASRRATTDATVKMKKTMGFSNKVSAAGLCTELAPAKAGTLRERGWCLGNRLRAPAKGALRLRPRKRAAARATRGIADHLKHRGLSSGTMKLTRAPGSDTRQAAQSGDVSRGWRSLRCSPSAGEPRTRR